MARGRRRVVRRTGGVPIKRVREKKEHRRKTKLKQFYNSPPLHEQPQRVVIMDEHNFAGVGTKLAKALQLRYDTVQYLPLRGGGLTAKRFLEAFGSGLEQNTLLLIIEPGTGAYQPDAELHRWLYHTYKRANRPNVPFGIYWCGSLCRVDNMVLQYNLPTAHSIWLRQRRDYLDSLTPLRLCATECLANIGIGHTYVGQPYDMPNSLTAKPATHRIMHTPTAPFKTDCFKGTANIRRGFDIINADKNCRVATEIVKYGTANTTILNKLDKATMYTLTMTDWDSGTGYGGIEALANGCLVFTKKPGNTNMKNPLVHVRTPQELYSKVKKFATNRQLYESRRRQQFNWAKMMFSPGKVAKRVYKAIQKSIDRGWR